MLDLGQASGKRALRSRRRSLHRSSDGVEPRVRVLGHVYSFYLYLFRRYLGTYEPLSSTLLRSSFTIQANVPSIRSALVLHFLRST